MTGYEEFNGGMSRKINVGDLGVPFREIPLTTGETHRVYDTSGPGYTPIQGFPHRRSEWIAAREARGDTNFSQMHYARKASSQRKCSSLPSVKTLLNLFGPKLPQVAQ